MKNFFILIIILAYAVPLTVDAAWYWLANSSYPDQGDFVQFDALEYAEFESKHLLTLVEDDLIEAVEQAKKYKGCTSDYDTFQNIIEGGSFSALNYWETKLFACATEQKIEEAREKAFKDCDLDYLDEELSSGEKVIYNKEIAFCRAEQQKDPVPEVKVETIPVHIETQPAILQQIIPVVVKNEPVSITPPLAVAEEEKAIMNTQEIDETSIEESNVENDDEDKEDIDRIPKEPEASTAQPNFFQKIMGFFSRLFSWQL